MVKSHAPSRTKMSNKSLWILPLENKLKNTKFLHFRIECFKLDIEFEEKEEMVLKYLHFLNKNYNYIIWII